MRAVSLLLAEVMSGVVLCDQVCPWDPLRLLPPMVRPTAPAMGGLLALAARGVRWGEERRYTRACVCVSTCMCACVRVCVCLNVYVCLSQCDLA